MIYLYTSIGLKAFGENTVHIYTQYTEGHSEIECPERNIINNKNI
jgi:hypothetical protein